MSKANEQIKNVGKDLKSDQILDMFIFARSHTNSVVNNHTNPEKSFNNNTELL